MPRSTMATMKDITTDREQLTGSALILTFVDDTERQKEAWCDSYDPTSL